MDQFTVLILVACSTLVLGGIIGLIIGRASGSPEQRKQLQKDLDSTNRELSQYKEQVTDHFTRTAELVNNLSESYRDVHQHLAKSADSLCGGEQLIQRLEQPTPSDAEEPETQSADSATTASDAVQPPKDYAPKAAPDAEGTLSENYGLQSQDDEPEHDPTKTADHAKSD
ncbi:MAG: DUF1043 family protein [Motiliproteus sp.]